MPLPLKIIVHGLCVKQRHTAQRIYERLREEHQFTGSSSTVRRYISKSRSCQAEVFRHL